MTEKERKYIDTKETTMKDQQRKREMVKKEIRKEERQKERKKERKKKRKKVKNCKKEMEINILYMASLSDKKGVLEKYN